MGGTQLGSYIGDLYGGLIWGAYLRALLEIPIGELYWKTLLKG